MSNYHRLLPENIEVGDVVLMPFLNDRIYPGIITKKQGNQIYYHTIDGLGVSDSGKDIIVVKKRVQGGLELHVGEEVHETFLDIFEKLK